MRKFDSFGMYVLAFVVVFVGLGVSGWSQAQAAASMRNLPEFKTVEDLKTFFIAKGMDENAVNEVAAKMNTGEYMKYLQKIHEKDYVPREEHKKYEITLFFCLFENREKPQEIIKLIKLLKKDGSNLLFLINALLPGSLEKPEYLETVLAEFDNILNNMAEREKQEQGVMRRLYESRLNIVTVLKKDDREVVAKVFDIVNKYKYSKKTYQAALYYCMDNFGKEALKYVSKRFVEESVDAEEIRRLGTFLKKQGHKYFIKSKKFKLKQALEEAEALLGADVNKNAAADDEKPAAKAE